MKKVEDLFYFLVRGLANCDFTMTTPLAVTYERGFGYDGVVDLKSNEDEVVIVSGYYDVNDIKPV